MDDLERRFHRAMIAIYEKAKREAEYNATRFLQMVSQLGGLGPLVNCSPRRRSARDSQRCGNAAAST